MRAFQAVSSVVYSVVLHALVSRRSAAAVSFGTCTFTLLPAALRPPCGYGRSVGSSSTGTPASLAFQ